PPATPHSPYTTLFRSQRAATPPAGQRTDAGRGLAGRAGDSLGVEHHRDDEAQAADEELELRPDPEVALQEVERNPTGREQPAHEDRKSTRLNSSHLGI